MKLLFRLIFLIALPVGLVLLYFFLRPFFYQKIETLVEEQLSKALKQKVSLASTAGSLFHNIVFKDINIVGENEEKLARAKSIKISFNPFKIIASRGNLAEGITKIKIDRPYLFLERDKKGLWNLQKIVPPPPPGAKPSIFSAPLIIEDASIDFKDNLGIVKSENKPSFSAQLEKISGKVNVEKSEKILLHLSGRFKEYKLSFFRVEGSILPQKRKYKLSIWGRNIPLTKNANYFLPSSVLNVLSGYTDFQIKLADSTPDPSRQRLPLKINAHLTLREASLRFSAFDQNLSDINGKINIYEDALHFPLLRGTLAGGPLTLKGKIEDFSKLKADLKVEAADFNLHQTVLFFPFLKKQKLQGQSELKLEITKELKNPRVFALAKIKNFRWFNYKITHLSASALFENKILNLKLLPTSILQGKVFGEAEIDFKKKPPLILANFSLQNFPPSFLWPSKNISGAFNGRVSSSGPLNIINISSKFTSSDFIFYEQKFTSLEGLFLLKNGTLYIENILAQHANSRLSGKGFFSPPKEFSFKASLQNIFFKEQKFSGIFSGDAEFKGKYEKDFLEKPFSSLSGQANLNINKVRFLDEDFLKEIKLNLTAPGKGTINIESIAATADGGTINLFGQIGQKGFSTNLLIEGERINLENIKYLKGVIPPPLSPLSGKTRFSLNIFDQISQFSSPQIKGKIFLQQGSFAEQKIEEAQSEFNFAEGKVNLKNAFFKTGNSSLSIAGALDKEKIDLKGTADIYLSDFLNLLRPYAAVNGHLKISGVVKRARNFWNLEDIDIAADDLIYNQIEVALFKVSGMKFKENKLTIPFSSPLETVILSNTYRAYGELKIQPSAPYFEEGNFKLVTENSDLQPFFQFFREVLKEIRPPKADLVRKTRLSKTVFGQNQIFLPIHQKKAVATQLLFRKGENILTPFSYFLELNEEFLADEKKDEFGVFEDYQGTISSASLELIFQKGKGFKGQSSIVLKNGKLGVFSFEEMAIDIDLSSALTSFSAEVFSGAFGQSKFDNLSLNLTYSDGWLTFKQFDFKKEKVKSFNILQGKFPLAAFWNKSYAHFPFKVKVHLEKNTISLLCFLNPVIEELRNEGEIKLLFSGTFKHPQIITESLNIKDGAIKLTYFPSWIKTKEAELEFANNVLHIKKLKLSWQGIETEKKENALEVMGNIGFEGLDFNNFHSLEIFFDLTALPESWKIDLTQTKLKEMMPLAYKGKLEFKDLSFKGSKRLLTISEPYPKLSATISLNDGNFYLTQIAAREKKENKFPLELELSVMAGKDLSAEISNLLLGDFGSIIGRMNLEFIEHFEPLQVSGTTNRIRLGGILEIDDGYLRILNKTFTLLPKTAQREFFSQELERIRANFLELKGQPLDTYLHLVAQTEIQEASSTSSVSTSEGESAAKEIYLKRIFLVTLDGPLQSFSTVLFEKYDGETAKPTKLSEYKMTKDLKGEQIMEIVNALIPDLHKGASGVLTKLTQQQIDTMVYSAVRPLEREAAKALALEDLRLDYSLGQKLIAADDTTPTTKIFGFEFAKKLFVDRLKIKLKTNVEESTMGSSYVLKLQSYKLIYSLSDYFSFNYENTKVEEQDPLKGLFSLEASLKF